MQHFATMKAKDGFLADTFVAHCVDYMLTNGACVHGLGIRPLREKVLKPALPATPFIMSLDVDALAKAFDRVASRRGCC